MNKIAKVKLLFNVDCEVKFEEGYPATMNSPKLRHIVEQSILSANLKLLKSLCHFYSAKTLVLWPTISTVLLCFCRNSK